MVGSEGEREDELRSLQLVEGAWVPEEELRPGKRIRMGCRTGKDNTDLTLHAPLCF